MTDLEIYVGNGFAIYSGKQGDIVLKKDFIAIIPLYMDEFHLEVTLDNFRLALFSIR